MFKIGMLSIIAATELFGVSNGVAADVDIRSHNKDVTATGGSDDVKMPENRASQLQMVDSEGKSISSPPLDKYGKASVEYVVPYTMPRSH